MNRPRSARLLVIVLVLAGVAVLALAGPASAKRRGGPAMSADGPSETQLAVRQLKQQIAAEELLIALELDGEQKAALVALVARVVEQREAKRAEHEAEAPTMKALLEDYLAEVQADGAPSGDTVEALRAFREGKRPDPEAMRAHREQTREELKSILDEEQLQTLISFRPMEAAGPTDEERAQRKEQRREHRAEMLEKHAEELDPADVEAMERMHDKRGKRHHGKRVAKELLFSPAMLEALSR